MRAFVQDRYGGPEVLTLGETDMPHMGPRDVQVRVLGASVNPADWFLLRGVPRLMRLALGLRGPKRRVPGRDVAGVVSAVGAEVTRFRVGDEVYGELGGGYGEYTTAPEEAVAQKPVNLDFESAAAVPLAGLTALQGLRDKGRVQPGERVLIVGAAGGVGTFAVQLAKALGAHVSVVCRAECAPQLHALGADEVVDYTQDDFTARPARYDVIFDLIGDRPLRACVRALTSTGRYVSSAPALGRILKVAVASLFSRRVAVLVSMPTAADLDYLTQQIEAGTVRPVIERVCEFEEVPTALAHQGRGHARGKTVIRGASVSGARDGAR